MVIYLLYSLGLVGLLVEGLEAGLVSRAFTGELAFIFFLENSTTPPLDWIYSWTNSEALILVSGSQELNSDP